jgi:hypothetical protein
MFRWAAALTVAFCGVAPRAAQAQESWEELVGCYHIDHSARTIYFSPYFRYNSSTGAQLQLAWKSFRGDQTPLAAEVQVTGCLQHTGPQNMRQWRERWTVDDYRYRGFATVDVPWAPPGLRPYYYPNASTPPRSAAPAAAAPTTEFVFCFAHPRGGTTTYFSAIEPFSRSLGHESIRGASYYGEQFARHLRDRYGASVGPMETGCASGPREVVDRAWTHHHDGSSVARTGAFGGGSTDTSWRLDGRTVAPSAQSRSRAAREQELEADAVQRLRRRRPQQPSGCGLSPDASVKCM